METRSFDQIPKVPAGLCESCEYVARLEEFVTAPDLKAAVQFAPFRDQGLASKSPERFRNIVLTCPRCGSHVVTKGEIAETPEEVKRSIVRIDIMFLPGIGKALKDKALRAIDTGSEWGRELLHLAEKVTE